LKTSNRNFLFFPGAGISAAGGGDLPDPGGSSGRAGRRQVHQGRSPPENLQGGQGDRQGRVADRQAQEEAGKRHKIAGFYNVNILFKI
jgi:hypothetical protein